ncbi:MAG TPA: single-stranded-DNA-specific exonuclease RecJ [bacterium]|nr:single-stranded-DNA-specific exonuclease RecJ [bacterium]
MLRAALHTPGTDPREQALARTLGLPDLVARVLLARGYDSPERARAFLRPDLGSLHDPFQFRDMQKAVDRIRDALRRGQPILIHGDYDVDGISGTVLLHKFFKLLHGTTTPFIPARADGYSFSPASVKAIRAGGFPLVVSVDNGTNAVAPIAELQRAGVDVIVTDHHGTTENVADAFCVLNPRLPGAGYPDRDLAGCGVAFCLVAAIAESLSGTMRRSSEFADFLVDAMGYIALGTVADVAPLRGENRTLVYHGLRSLSVSRSPGIRALMDAAGLLHRGANVEDIAFRIAPLINAAGRVGHADDAVQLLCARNFPEAQTRAKVLEQHNEQRRRVERQLQDEVQRLAADERGPTIVLGGDHWHPGVLGIVAARIAETSHKPVLLLAFDGDTGRGSGRCTSGVHLRDALGECADLLVSHGGHAAAAGLEIRREQFPAFRERFAEVCSRLAPAEPPLTVDGPAEFAELEPHAVRRLDVLAPFGNGHARPRFVTHGVRLVGNPYLDVRGQHVRVRVTKDGAILPARVLRGASLFETMRQHKGPWSLSYSPRISSRGEDGPVQLDVHDLSRDQRADSTAARRSR